MSLIYLAKKCLIYTCSFFFKQRTHVHSLLLRFKNIPIVGFAHVSFNPTHLSWARMGDDDGSRLLVIGSACCTFIIENFSCISLNIVTYTGTLLRPHQFEYSRIFAVAGKLDTCSPLVTVDLARIIWWMDPGKCASLCYELSWKHVHVRTVGYFHLDLSAKRSWTENFKLNVLIILPHI